VPEDAEPGRREEEDDGCRQHERQLDCGRPQQAAHGEVRRERGAERREDDTDGEGHRGCSQVSVTTVPASLLSTVARPAAAATRAMMEARMPRRSSGMAAGSNPGPVSPTRMR